MTRIPVSLEWYECAKAAQVGLSRSIEAMREGKSSRFSGERNWSAHIEGALGEAAFAKATRRYWSGSVNTFKEGGDVGAIQVRTRSRPDFPLYVRPTDRDDDIFVLVTGELGNYEVVGWCFGREAKQDKYLVTNMKGWRPTYMVPAKDLHDPRSLVVEEFGYG